MFDCILLLFYYASIFAENKVKLQTADLQTLYVTSFHYSVCL